MLTASFYSPTKRVAGSLELESVNNGHRDHIASLPCQNKREARKLAKEYNAQPWNF